MSGLIKLCWNLNSALITFGVFSSSHLNLGAQERESGSALLEYEVSVFRSGSTILIESIDVSAVSSRDELLLGLLDDRAVSHPGPFNEDGPLRVKDVFYSVTVKRLPSKERGDGLHAFRPGDSVSERDKLIVRLQKYLIGNWSSNLSIEEVSSVHLKLLREFGTEFKVEYCGPLATDLSSGNKESIYRWNVGMKDEERELLHIRLQNSPAVESDFEMIFRINQVLYLIVSFSPEQLERLSSVIDQPAPRTWIESVLQRIVSH